MASKPRASSKATSVRGTSRCSRCRARRRRHRAAGARSRLRRLPRQAHAGAGRGVELERLVGRATRQAGAASYVSHPEPGLARSASRGSEPVRVSSSRRRTGATVGAEADLVAVEEPMEVRVNGAPFAVIMRTPGEDMALAAGSCSPKTSCAAAEKSARSSGARRRARSPGNVLNVTVVGDAVDRLVVRLGERRQVTTTSACGLCGRRTIESLRSRAATVDGRWTVPAAVVSRLPLALRAAQRPSMPPAACTPPRSATSRARSCASRGRRPAQRPGQDHGPRAARRRGCRSIAPCSSLSGRTSYELVQKALLAACRWWRRCRPPRVSPSTWPTPPASPCAALSVATA